MKKIILVHDMSGYGNCSMTVCMPVLNALGHETHPLPTGILSNATSYGDFYIVDMHEHIDGYLKAWECVPDPIDVVYCGFSSNFDVILKSRQLAENKGAMLFIDPVMGDNGKLYCCFENSLIDNYKKIISHADLITPNLTEACFLTDNNYEQVLQIKTLKALKNKVESMMTNLYSLGCKKVIITGVPFNNFIYTIYYNGKDMTYIRQAKQSVNYTGTGDTFGSLFLGYSLNLNDDILALKKSVKFMSQAIKISIENNTPARHGIDFCKLLKKL